MTQNSSTFSFRRYIRYFVIGFMAFTMLFFGASEFVIERYVNPNDALKAHVEFLRRGSGRRYLVLAIGDSHTAYGIEGSTSLMNAAYPGDTVSDMVLKSRYALRKSQAQRLILQADPHLFSRYRLTSDRNYASYLNEEADVVNLHVFDPYHRHKLLRYWRVLLRDGGFRTNIDYQTSHGGIVDQRYWSNLEVGRRSNIARSRTGLHEPTENFEKHRMFQQYQMIIEEALQSEIEVCMVGFPVAEEYWSYTNKKNLWRDVRKSFQKMASEYGVAYLNYATIYLNSPALFSDGDHLNNAGRKRFSRKVLQDCFG